MLHYTLKFDYFTEYIPISIYIAVIYTHLSLKTCKKNFPLINVNHELTMYTTYSNNYAKNTWELLYMWKFS